MHSLSIIYNNNGSATVRFVVFDTLQLLANIPFNHYCESRLNSAESAIINRYNVSTAVYFTLFIGRSCVIHHASSYQ